MRDPSFALARGGALHKWVGAAKAILLHIPVLDHLYGTGKPKRFYFWQTHWDLKQACLAWGEQPPVGSVVIGKPLTTRIFAAEQDTVGL